MSKNRKKTAKDEYKEFTPVFKLKPLSVTETMCKYIGNIHSADKLTDDVLEVEDESGKLTNILQFGTIKNYSVFGKTCSCNVIADYFVKKTKDNKLVINNKKIPVYYMSVLYANQLVTGFLVTVFVYFNLDEKSQKELDNPKKIVNRRMTGHYTLELVTDEGFLSRFIEKMSPILEERLMGTYYDEFEAASDDQKEEIFKKINLQVESTLNEYRSMIDVVKLDKLPTRKYATKVMYNLIKNKHFNDIIEFALEFREKERRNNMCPDQSYEAPKNVINLQEFKDHPEKLDEYINNLSESDNYSDSDSDNHSDIVDNNDTEQSAELVSDSVLTE
jgi:hypothetical protein